MRYLRSTWRIGDCAHDSGFSNETKGAQINENGNGVTDVQLERVESRPRNTVQYCSVIILEVRCYVFGVGLFHGAPPGYTGTAYSSEVHLSRASKVMAEVGDAVHAQ
jgi:hypothetical protein